MKISKKFLTILISGLAISCCSIAYACLHYWPGNESVIKPYDQCVDNTISYYPFLHSSRNETIAPDTTYNKNYPYFGINEELVILNEWIVYFNHKISENELRELLYNSNKNTFDSIKDYLADDTSPLSEKLANNTLVKAWCCKTQLDVLEYMNYIAPPSEKENDYEQNNSAGRKENILADQIKFCENQISKCKTPFLKTRYAYQLVRKYRANNQREKSLATFDKYLKNDSTSVLRYWAEVHVAGMYYAYDKPKALIILADIFTKCPSRREVCFNDFDVDNDSIWHAALNACKNNTEKANLWFLTGVKNKNAALISIQEMLQLDPAHVGLEVLGASEIERYQRNILPQRNLPYQIQYSDFQNWKITRPHYTSPDKLIQVLNEAVQHNEIKNKAFWLCNLGYVYSLNKNYKESERCLNEAFQIKDISIQLHDQIRRLLLLNKINSMEKISSVAIDEVLPELEWLAAFKKNGESDKWLTTYNNDALRLSMKKLSDLYKQNGDVARNALCFAIYETSFDFRYKSDENVITKLVPFYENKTPTPFDEFLLRMAGFSKNELYELLGTINISKRNWDQAKLYLEQIENPATVRTFGIKLDPFKSTIHDYLGIDYASPEYKTVMTKLDICNRVIKLQKELKQPGVALDSIYNQLGNVYYNTSRFGNTWYAGSHFQNNYCFTSEDGYYNENCHFFGTDNCSDALFYYKQAVLNTHNKEFAALNVFMMAKCEQTFYYLSSDYDEYNKNGLKSSYQKSFADLNTNYNNTEFYKALINECKYFKYYVNTTH